MTLLHQAAQKAVEALRLILPMAKGYAYNTHRVKANEDMCDQAAASLAALESALQQQPEPVALKDGVPNTEAAIAYALERWGYRQGTKECIAFYRGACWLQLAAPPALQHQEVPREPVAEALSPRERELLTEVKVRLGEINLCQEWRDHAFAVLGRLAASPSTTRQQEVGSGWKLVPTRLSPSMQTKLFHGLGISGRECEERYQAMLAAAPSTPEKAGGVKECPRCFGSGESGGGDECKPCGGRGKVSEQRHADLIAGVGTLARCAHHPSKCPHWEDCRARQECVGAPGVALPDGAKNNG